MSSEQQVGKGEEPLWGEPGWQDTAEACSAGRGVSQVTDAS